MENQDKEKSTATNLNAADTTAPTEPTANGTSTELNSNISDGAVAVVDGAAAALVPSDAFSNQRDRTAAVESGNGADVLEEQSGKKKNIVVPLDIIEESDRKAVGDDQKLAPSQHTLNEILRANSERRTSTAAARVHLHPVQTPTATAGSSSPSSTAPAAADSGDKDATNRNLSKLNRIMDEAAVKPSTSGSCAEMGSAAVADFDADNEPTPTVSIRSIGSFVCRICHNAENPERLVSPCLCKGSLTYVHIHCLERWISTSRNTSCELCQFQYNTQQTLRYTCVQSLRMWYSRAMSRRALQEDCQMFSLLTLVAFGIIGTLLVGIQYSFLQGRTWGLGRFWTKGWLVFSLLTTVVVYFINVYMLVRSQLAPWYRWWQSARDIRLVLENRKPFVFRPSQRFQIGPNVDTTPPMLSASAMSISPPQPQPPTQPQPQPQSEQLQQQQPNAEPPAVADVAALQTASQFQASVAVRFHLSCQFEKMTNEFDTYKNINSKQNFNKNCASDINNNIWTHYNNNSSGDDYDCPYNNRNNNKDFNKYNGVFLAPSTDSVVADDAVVMPTTKAAAVAAAGGASSVGVASVSILLEPNRN